MVSVKKWSRWLLNSQIIGKETYAIPKIHTMVGSRWLTVPVPAHPIGGRTPECLRCLLLLLRVLNGGLPAQESLRTRPPNTLCLFLFYWGIFIFSASPGCCLGVACIH